MRFVCKISKISEYILSMHFYIIDDFGWFAFFTVSNTNDTNTFASERREKNRQQQHSCELHRAIDNWSDEGLNFIRMQFTASHIEFFLFLHCHWKEIHRWSFFLLFFSSSKKFSNEAIENWIRLYGRRCHVQTGSYSGHLDLYCLARWYLSGVNGSIMLLLLPLHRIYLSIMCEMCYIAIKSSSIKKQCR